MRLLSIEIENWGPIRELKAEIKPDARIILLQATNGAGKSTIIHALGNLLSYRRGGNTWGGAELITYGADRGRIRAVFANAQGQTIDLEKVYHRTGRTVLRAKTNGNADPITHSDRIRDELVKIFGVDPQEQLQLLFARQFQMAELLHAEPSVRERQFLEQVNLKHVVDAEDRLLKTANTITVNTNLSDLLAQAEKELANRQAARTAADTLVKTNEARVEALKPGHEAHIQWQRVLAERAERTTTEGKMMALMETAHRLGEQITQKLAGQPRETLNQRIAQAHATEQLADRGSELKQTCDTLAPALGQTKDAEASLEAAQRQAKAYTKENEQRRGAMQSEETELTNRIAKERAHQQTIRNAQDEVKTTEGRRQPAPNLEVKTNLEANLETIQQVKTRLQETQRRIREVASEINQTQTDLKTARTNLEHPSLKTAPERFKRFRDIIYTQASKQMMEQVLANWGKPAEAGGFARCPISHLELLPDAEIPRLLTQTKLQQLASANPEELADPQKDLNLFQQWSARAHQLQANLDRLVKHRGELQTVEAQFLANLQQTPEKPIREELQRWTTVQANHQQSEARYQAATQALTRLQATPSQPEAEMTTRLQLVQQERQTLEALKTAAQTQHQLATQINRQLDQLRPQKLKAEAARAAWVTWCQTNSNLAEADLKGVARQAREDIANLMAIQATISEEKTAIGEAGKLALALATKAQTPEPPITNKEAETAEAHCQQTITALEQSRTSTKQAQIEEARAVDALAKTKADHEVNERRRRVKTALTVAANYLNYQQIPRQIVTDEFSRVLGLTNGLLRDLGIGITLSHTNFDVYAGMQKPGIGWIYTRVGLLSGGEKTITGQAMRLAVKKRLCPELELMIFDEPSTSIAEENVEKLVNFLSVLRNGLNNLGIAQLFIADHHRRMTQVADQVITWS